MKPQSILVLASKPQRFPLKKSLSLSNYPLTFRMEGCIEVDPYILGLWSDEMHEEGVVVYFPFSSLFSADVPMRQYGRS